MQRKMYREAQEDLLTDPISEAEHADLLRCGEADYDDYYAPHQDSELSSAIEAAFGGESVAVKLSLETLRKLEIFCDPYREAPISLSDAVKAAIEAASSSIDKEDTSP